VVMTTRCRVTLVLILSQRTHNKQAGTCIQGTCTCAHAHAHYTCMSCMCMCMLHVHIRTYVVHAHAHAHVNMLHVHVHVHRACACASCMCMCIVHVHVHVSICACTSVHVHDVCILYLAPQFGTDKQTSRGERVQTGTPPARSCAEIRVAETRGAIKPCT